MTTNELQRKLRLVLVIEEERFHHPGFVDELIRVSPHPVVGAVRVIEAPPQSDVMTYLRQHIYRFKPSELFKYAVKLIIWSIRQLLGGKNSVADVLQTHQIPFFDVRRTINTKDIRSRIAAWSPDIIISSNPLYFGKKLLELPRLGCINRHTALLPAYGGILPLFHALARQEPRVGVTIHRMTEEIDKGPILAQAAVEVKDKDTMESLFTRCFALTVPLVLQAIDTLQTPEKSSIEPRTRPSTFSFPDSRDWKAFRRAGRDLI